MTETEHKSRRQYREHEKAFKPIPEDKPKVAEEPAQQEMSPERAKLIKLLEELRQKLKGGDT